ncbi:ATP-binding protein [Aquipuribacter nitratireducens]|uniref:ATP-binding protein n=1 Tax=Aquipuribacter nitratireducens TaxID=650104 RepID=A0ABW0GPM8_9MICO
MADELRDTVATLVARVRRLGTDTARIEVKAAAGGLPKSTGETLSAFQNTSGGVVLLGLAESEGFRPAEGFNASAVRDALAGLCADAMEPPLRAEIDIVPFEGREVVVLEVPPLDPVMQPSHIRTKGAYAGSFFRSGDGDRRLTHYEVTQLLSNRSQPLHDTEVVPTATLDDLSDTAVDVLGSRLATSSSRAFSGLTREQMLIRAGAATRDHDGTVRPTVAGVLCLGEYPQQFFPQLLVSFVALPGSTLGDTAPDGTRFLDNAVCDGTIPQMLEGVLAACRRNMRTAAVIRGSGREDRHDYPVEVIRELVVNALLHRDYSAGARGTQVQVELFPDRLVVKSPGGLFGNVVPSQLGVEEVSSTRNATLARLLADVPGADGLPVSENRGSGLSFVMARLRRAGMSPPSFDVTPAHVHVTVPQQALLEPDTVAWIGSLTDAHLTDEQHIALALMRTTGTVSNEMLRAWGVGSHDATAALRGLVDKGLAVKLGGRRYATYELAATPPDGAGFHGADQLSIVGVEDDDAKDPRPGAPVPRGRDAGLEAVIQAVRAGADSTRTITETLGVSVATTTRRVNALLTEGRLGQTAGPHSRSRRFFVIDPGSDRY